MYILFIITSLIDYCFLIQLYSSRLLSYIYYTPHPLRAGESLPIRLADGTSPLNGRVEVYYNGTWGTVCDDYWDIHDGQVVCRQLGFVTALAVHGTARFGQGEGE